MTRTKAPSIDYAALAELPAWEAAGRFGCRYAGDWSPYRHGGMFYRAKDWAMRGFAQLVKIHPPPAKGRTLSVLRGIVYRTVPECRAWDIDREIIATVQDRGFTMRNHRTLPADIEPDEFYRAIADWLAVLGRED